MTDHGHHHHAGFGEAEWARWAVDAEREGEVLIDFVTSTAARVAELPGWAAPRRIVDVGSGPAVAACEFARHFLDAEVIAFDSSAAMLERASDRIGRLGLDSKVHVVLGEIPGDLGLVGDADLVWASMSLHHVGDEVAALRALGETLSPTGVLVIAEMAEPTRMLPPDLGIGRVGLAERLERAGAEWFAHMRHALPSAVESQDLAVMVEATGCTVLDDRVERIRLDAPLAVDTRQFIVGWLTRTRAQLESVLDAEDLAVLDVLPGRDDLFVEASRRIVIAERGGTLRPASPQ